MPVAYAPASHGTSWSVLLRGDEFQTTRTHRLLHQTRCRHRDSPRAAMPNPEPSINEENTMNKTLLATALVAVIAATAFAPTAQAANSGTITSWAG